MIVTIELINYPVAMPRAFSFILLYTIYMSKKITEIDSEQLYCSVDLEFTGFDPSRDQILEIGFAFFKVSDGSLKVVEEWSQVFKPSIEVHPKIYGLTGITPAELADAPQFSEHREFLQSKLGEAIIVGHNPVMDVKFLEAYGLTLSGKVIDTLELVQFILPTHHSYNLENLVHYFGVPHTAAHRALGDALSTIGVLENLIRVYNGFSDELKEELAEVVKREEFLWEKLVSSELAPKEIETHDSLHHVQTKQTLPDIENNTQSVIAVPDSGTVMRLWQSGTAHGVFRTEDTFSKKAFQSFLKRAATRDELRFCLKIIVWLHTNWQTEAVLDLNISFFGGQFRQFIIGGEPNVKDEPLIVVDYATLQSIPFGKRNLIIQDMQAFERHMSTGFGTWLGWNNVLYALRLVYNPETEFGDKKLKDEVISALGATDLFFSLVYMLLHRTFPSNQYATLSELVRNHGTTMDRLKRAAENLKAKIDPIMAKASSGELHRISNYLDTFFEEDQARVKWITIDEQNPSFHDQPIDISPYVKTLLEPFTKVEFTESIEHTEILSYLVDRLGLDTEVSELIKDSQLSKLQFEVSSESVSNSELFNTVMKSELPLVMLMPSPLDVKEFYNSYYPQIKEKASLFAQGYSGGGNKMFRNFSINSNSILLLTADFMAKQNYTIPAKTIIFSGQPMLDETHPYTAALLKHWQERHPNLRNVLVAAKMNAALKKVKQDDKITVKFYNLSKNISFWG